MNQNPLEISPNEKSGVTAIDIHCTPNKRISIDLEKDSNQLLLKNSLSSSDRQSELDAYCRHSSSFDGVDVATTQDTIEPETVSHEDSTTNHSEQQSNANAVPEATETTNNSQTMDAQVREAYLGLQEAETKLYVNRIIGFFVTMIISSAYMLLITHFNVDPYLIYTFIICYLGYYDMFTIFLVPETLRELWIDSDDFYKLGDITCGLIFIVVLLLRISNIISACYYVSAIFLASLVIYRQTSTTPRKEQTYEVLTRLYYLLQVVMITSKLDGIMDFEWSIVFLPSWLYAAGLLFCFTRSLSGLMSRLMRDHTTSIRSKIIGFVWFLFYRISILSLVGVLAGVVEGRDPGTDHTIIDNASYIVLILSVPLLIASALKKKMLINFIVTFELIDSHVLRYSAEELITIHDKLKKITFELQDKKAYFMMVSSTYFLPLDQSPSLNNREHSQAKAVAAKTNKSTLELSEYPLSDKESGNNLQTSLLPQDKEEKNFCYVCCKDPSNTIFTTCGHGGVCLDCAIASVKQKGECLQCRKKIEAIHTIDPNEISSNIIRSMQSYKIVKT